MRYIAATIVNYSRASSIWLYNAQYLLEQSASVKCSFQFIVLKHNCLPKLYRSIGLVISYANGTTASLYNIII